MGDVRVGRGCGGLLCSVRRVKRWSGALVGVAGVALWVCVVSGCGSSPSASGTVTQTVVAPSSVASSDSAAATIGAVASRAGTSDTRTSDRVSSGAARVGQSRQAGTTPPATGGSASETSGGYDTRGKVSAPGLVEVPDVEGMAYSQAASLVRSRGFRVSRMTSPSSRTPGVVTYVSPRLIWLEPGSVVTLVVSVPDGGGRSVGTHTPTGTRTATGGAPTSRSVPTMVATSAPASGGPGADPSSGS